MCRRRLIAMGGLRLFGLLTIGVTLLRTPATGTFPRAVVVMMPRVTTVHPPAPEGNELHNHHEKEAEEEKTEEAADEAKRMPTPPVAAIETGVAAMGEGRRHDFGLLATTSQQPDHKPFIPTGLANAADNGAEKQNPNDARDE